MPPIDPVELTVELVRRDTVTPDKGAGVDVIARALEPLGFRCVRVDRGGVANLYARYGTSGPVFGFNGHTDVVPTGDPEAWTHAPFSGAREDGAVWGRGAVDMKSGVAAFAAAAAAVAAEKPDGSIALLVTGDEEGDARDGTLALLDWMKEQGERLDVCLVGEPTSAERLGDTIKIGRRGSLTARFHAKGTAGHAAYPQLARNPLPPLVRLLDRLAAEPLDEGTEHFDPSTLAITTIDVGNPAQNVIPAEARATVNIRYNDAHDGETLTARLRAAASEAAVEGVTISVETRVSGESFFTEPGAFTEVLSDAVASETGERPGHSTTGGTSDARFVKDHCPVVEFGLVGRGMHATDERAAEDQIAALSRIYADAMRRFFAQG